jgi:hypothetical protein
LGGGIWTNKSQPVVINTIIWGNQAGTYPQISGSPTVVYSDIQGGYAGTGNINADPLFADTENGDFHLLENSPGIGWGTDSSIVPKSDFYGNKRPDDIDDFVDMGAIESPFEQTPTVIDDMSNIIPFEFGFESKLPQSL